jgi:hypothetical protein
MVIPPAQKDKENTLDPLPKRLTEIVSPPSWTNTPDTLVDEDEYFPLNSEPPKTSSLIHHDFYIHVPEWVPLKSKSQEVNEIDLLRTQLKEAQLIIANLEAKEQKLNKEKKELQAHLNFEREELQWSRKQCHWELALVRRLLREQANQLIDYENEFDNKQGEINLLEKLIADLHQQNDQLLIDYSQIKTTHDLVQEQLTNTLRSLKDLQQENKNFLTQKTKQDKNIELLRKKCYWLRGKLNQTLIDLANEKTCHNLTQIHTNSISQQLNQTQTLLNAYESYLTEELKITDLNALPTLPTGKSLMDLISHICQPCPHSDYGTIKNERDNLKTELANKDQKISELETQLQEKDRIIAELQNKPPVSPVNDREPEPTNNKPETSESLLRIINQQQATIKELQTQIGKSEIKEIVKEIPVKDLAVIRELQEKIKSKDQSLTQWRYFCLFSVVVIILLAINTVRLLVRKKTKR